MKKSYILWFSLFFLILLSACLQTKVIKSTYTPEQLNNELGTGDFVKIHLKDGGLYVLNLWSIDRSGDTIRGFGKYYNYTRQLKEDRIKPSSEAKGSVVPFTVPKGIVTLIEADKLKGNLGNLAAVSIVGVPFSMMSLYCLTNPKACFGSCPTFYAQRNGKWTMMAEGFSSSIAPSFEKSDIDMLYGVDETQNNFTLKLTNEALETHVIRYVDLLAFPKTSGELVFATAQGQFYRTSGVVSPLKCISEEGNCLKQIEALDGIERYSAADAKNLSKKEEIILTFDHDPKAEEGFVIGTRQTMLTTHLFYQVMAYTGNHYGALVADLENGNEHLLNRIQQLWNKLGGIEIFVKGDGNRWMKVGDVDEMGPIATDVHLIKLPHVGQKKLTLKLRMTKGLWRIDYMALAKIIGEETPERIKPTIVLREDSADVVALSKLTMNQEPLVTMPGDQYYLKYKLPSDCSYQVFLETKGYYLEWMREKWLEEENLKKAAVALYFPGLFMRMAAPGYKKAEPQMEKVFWESRYVNP